MLSNMGKKIVSVIGNFFFYFSNLIFYFFSVAGTESIEEIEDYSSYRSDFVEDNINIDNNNKRNKNVTEMKSSSLILIFVTT